MNKVRRISEILPLRVSTSGSEALSEFAAGPTAYDRWDAARRLMAARELKKAAEQDEFAAGFAAVGEEAKTGEGLPRLLAVDLLVRVSSFLKRLKPEADRLLSDALTRELPPLSEISNTKDLPPEAKPAAVRENVAIALRNASGDWVMPYIIRGMVDEDRSQRCRLELARQLADRETLIDNWLSWLSEQPWDEIIPVESGPDAAATRLRDLSSVLVDIAKKERARITVTVEAAQNLARLCKRTIRLPLRKAPSGRLGAAATEIARLLDEILTARLRLIDKPEAYVVLETFHSWWYPLPYPDSLKAALVPIVDKLITGITFRALRGQRSDTLARRLRQSIEDQDEAKRRLRNIAQQETDLSSDIDDWLRGKTRIEAATAQATADTLRSVAMEDATIAIAPLLLDVAEASSSLGVATKEELSNEIRRMANRLRTVARERGLEIVGQPGDEVEFSPLAHQTTSGQTPAEPRVKIIRPMVVRKRQDGTEDILVKALVTDL